MLTEKWAEFPRIQKVATVGFKFEFPAEPKAFRDAILVPKHKVLDVPSFGSRPRTWLSHRISGMIVAQAAGNGVEIR